MVKDLQHQAQTAVALRVTLEGRGTRVKPLSLGIPPELLRKKATILKQQESTQRDNLKVSMTKMQSDVEIVLSNKEFPEKMREVAQEMKKGLEENLRHLKSGKPVTKMPMAIELVDNGSIGESYALPTEEELLQDIVATQNEPQADGTELTKTETKRGIFRRFIEWLNSPWDKSWKDIDKKR